MAKRRSKRRSLMKRVLSEKERKVVDGLAQGLTHEKAGLKAGYSATTAAKKIYQILERPLVKSALTEAFERVGGSMEELMRPIVEGLKAQVVVKAGEIRTGGSKGKPVEVKHTFRAFPDYKTRLIAAELGMALFGGLPKQLEAPPAPSQGLTVIFEDEGKDGTKRRIAAKIEASGEPVKVVFEKESASQEGARQKK